MTKRERILIKAIKLALGEFERIGYQIRADPDVLGALRLVVQTFENKAGKPWDTLI